MEAAGNKIMVNTVAVGASLGLIGYEFRFVESVLKKEFATAQEWGKRIPIGLLYKQERPVYEEQFSALEKLPLAKQKLDPLDYEELLDEFM